MSGKSKIEATEKIKIVERYQNGEISQKTAAKICSVNKRSVQDWIRIYKAEGPTGLLKQSKNKRYSKELKLQAVNDYLDGNGSLDDLCIKYGIRHRSPLIGWIKVYNSGKELKELTGGASMKKARETTLEERLHIVKECLENDRDFGAMAIKYSCSYQQVWNWVTKYEKMGPAGLEDRRGKRAGSQPSRAPEEALRDRVAELEWKNKDLQIENELLKKVRELERRNRFL
ncbi:MAG TPA: helix-turn-helix domain-containing protein [Syntrophomonas sp.]|nr:helix-turn-helix domain-containing protein [Syntrophomonas sp.]